MAFRPQYQDQYQTLGANGGAFVNQPGRPITFKTGQFAGDTIRVELKELQKADSGRKFAKVDRRPLDPPPTVLLRLFKIDGFGTDKEWEREVDNYEDIRNLGILCNVDLFPVPDKVLDHGIEVPESTATSNIPAFAAAYTPSQTSSSPGSSPGAQYMHPRASRVSSAQGSPPFELTTSGVLKLNYAASNTTSENTYTYFPLHPFTTPSAESDGAPPRVSPFQIPRRQPMLVQLNEAEPPSDVILRIGNHFVTESSKMTPALAGEKFVEPTLIDHMGMKCLVFVFGDLAVQREGTFIFRYRAFDIFSGGIGDQVHPMLAELYGGPFRVYSTREFPGLEPSTDLTRNLAKSGVRVALRDAERKSRKRGDSERDT